MGIDRCAIFMRGIHISRDEVSDYGIENLWDDKWLPHIEGHPGTFIRINFSNTGAGDVYIGFAVYDPYDWRGDIVEAIEFEIPTKMKVYENIKNIGIHCDFDEIKDMLIGIDM
jgi:hypothetical protein